MATHPTLSVFGRTASAPFPLILVVGREPNTDLPIVPAIGPYDFRWAPRCGFWNTSYGAIARVMNMNTAQLKALCVERDSSPIVYADALPIGLKNHTPDKHKHRSEVGPDAVEQHIRAIFQHESLTPRIRLVLVSGLSSAPFNAAVTALGAEASTRSIPLVHVPFFFGTNTKKIQKSLNEESRAIIAEVIRGFCSQ